MALIKCPKCAGTVSTKASACPHCGAVASEKERLEKLADELGSMSAALTQLEQCQSRSVENASPVSTSENLPPSVPLHEETVPKRKYSTGDIVLYSVLWIAMAMFFIPGLYIVITGYFKKPSSAGFAPATKGETRPDPANFR